MRTTEGKPVLDRIEQGDPQWSARLAHALGHMERDDQLTHGFHTYPAGLHPDAAGELLEALPGEHVLDPFCGGGTVLVEAMVRGRKATGRDVSTVALLVATARTMLTTEEQRTSLRSTARRLAEVAQQATAMPDEARMAFVADWYAPYVLAELEAIRQGIEVADVTPGVRTLLWACLSSILIKVSWRRSDTSGQRAEHRRPPGTTAVLFHKKARELGRRLEALAAATPEGTPVPDVDFGDARALTLTTPADLVITSPPYPSVYDYLPMQAMREVWLGRSSPREAEIGPRRAWHGDRDLALRNWQRDTATWLQMVGGATRPGGTLVCIIGDGLVDGEVVHTIDPTSSLAVMAGWAPVARASLARPDHARADVRWEHAVMFRREADPT